MLIVMESVVVYNKGTLTPDTDLELGGILCSAYTKTILIYIHS